MRLSPSHVPRRIRDRQLAPPPRTVRFGAGPGTGAGPAVGPASGAGPVTGLLERPPAPAAPGTAVPPALPAAARAVLPVPTPAAPPIAVPAAWRTRQIIRYALPGGGAADLRAADADDEDAVRAFLGGLSPDSAYRRFFTGIGPQPVTLARRLVQIRPDRVAMLALAGAEVVGVADTALVDGGRAVELGVVLADGWQRRGLGWPLCRAALEPALALGAETLVAHTQPDNARVARMLRRQWPDGRPRLDDGTYVWALPLAGMTGAAARER